MASKWTIMVYLVATDTQLSQRVETELNDIRSGLSGQDVRVLAFIKSSGPGVPVTYVEVHPDGDRREDQHEDKDAADPATVCEFVRWAHEKAPADRYGLILWGHGSGFRPDERPTGPEDMNEAPIEHGEIDLRVWQAANRLFFRRSTEWIVNRASSTAERAGDMQLPNEHDTEDAVVSDQITGHSIDSKELEHTSTGVASILGQRLDLLGMDACLMASAELLAQVREQAEVVVASEHVIGDFGWPYTEILGSLCHHCDMSALELGSKIVDVCVSYYEDKIPSWPVTQSAFDCGRWHDFCRPMSALSQALQHAVTEYWSDVLRAHTESVALKNDRINCGLFDLLSFCLALSNHVKDAAVVAAAGAVAEALRPGALVAREGHHLVPESLVTKKVPVIGGLSVYLPMPPAQLLGPDLASPAGYSELRFDDEVGWSGFLSAYHQAVKNG